MVVFRSPAQQQRRTLFSASPGPPGAFDEDPDNIFNATPGPARARSVLEGASVGNGGPRSSSHVKLSAQDSENKGVPGSAVLQRRLQQSLMMVAESPSSKLNAPDPFRPRKQLRRSPPVAMRAFDHREDGVDKQEDSAARTAERQDVLLMDEPVPQLLMPDTSVPSHKNQEKQRSFDLAARALFDDKRSARAPANARTRASLPALGRSTAFLTPQASTSRHRLPSLQETDIRRSAPMRQATTNTSTLSARFGRSPAALPGSPGKNATPVRALAKIGRLTARNADLEARMRSTASELDSILQTHQALQEECELIKQEKAAALARLQEYEEIATQCEEVIESHDRLVLNHIDLEQQRQADIVELETVKEAMGRLKWKERKLRHELNIRREEGIFKEYELQNEHLNPTLRELRKEQCNLKVVIADLQEKISVLRYEKSVQSKSLQAAQQDLIWYEDVTKTHQDDLSTLQTRVEKRTRVIAELEEEQRQLSQRLAEETEENDQLKLRLEDYKQRITDLERQNEQVKEAQNEYVGGQTVARRLEKRVKDLETQLADRIEEMEKKARSLQKANKDKEVERDQAVARYEKLYKDSEEQLNQSKTDLKAIELKLRLVEKERDQLKSTWDMHRRASRVFGDGPSQTDAEAGIGAALPPLTEYEMHANGMKLVASPLGKRKRSRKEEVRRNSNSSSEESEPDEEEAEAVLSDAVPPPPQTEKTARVEKTKATTNTTKSKKQVRKAVLSASDRSVDNDGADVRPAKWKTQAKAKEGPSPSDVTSASESELFPKQIKRKRRRTAIKSGVPQQFRNALKDEADDRIKREKGKPGKKKVQALSESESESSESSSEDSNTPKVASSPHTASTTNNSTRNKLAKTPASQPVQSSKTASGRTKVAVKTEKTGDTSAKSGISTTGSSQGAKKKITLHKSASSSFIWRNGSAGASQPASSRGLLDLPDILSPVVRR